LSRSDSGQPENGNGVEHEKVAVLQLTFTPSLFRLEIGGSVENFDMALAMLEQAKRHFEGELRKANAIALQQQMTRMAEDQRIAAAMRRH
jgi:hypothetical protein